MTRRIDLPSEPKVRAVLARLRQQATGSGRRLTVLALAREFGLSNSTFRRHFPDVARDIAEASRSGPPAASTPTSRYDMLITRNAKLKRRNRELHAQLTLAAAREVPHLPTVLSGPAQPPETQSLSGSDSRGNPDPVSCLLGNLGSARKVACRHGEPAYNTSWRRLPPKRHGLAHRAAKIAVPADLLPVPGTLALRVHAWY